MFKKYLLNPKEGRKKERKGQPRIEKISGKQRAR